MGRTFSTALFTLGAACAVTVAGCGSGTSADRAADADAGRTVKASLAKLRTAETYRVVVSGKDDGKPLALDLHYGTNGVDGTLGMDGTTVALKVTGDTVYFKAPDSFWRERAGSDDSDEAAAVIERFGDTWVKTSKQSEGGKEFAEVADSSSFLELFTKGFSDADAANTKRAGTSRVGGVPTTTYSDGTGENTIDIAASGYPLKVVAREQKNDGGSIVFGNWNEPYTVVAPKRSVSLPS